MKKRTLKAWNKRGRWVMLKRIRAALRTNEPQMLSVVGLTALNGIALLKRTGDTPIWLIVGALAFWPLLAFVANLVSPIPSDPPE